MGKNVSHRRLLEEGDIWASPGAWRKRRPLDEVLDDHWQARVWLAEVRSGFSSLARFDRVGGLFSSSTWDDLAGLLAALTRRGSRGTVAVDVDALGAQWGWWGTV